jgi:N utilization substance protein B
MKRSRAAGGRKSWAGRSEARRYVLGALYAAETAGEAAPERLPERLPDGGVPVEEHDFAGALYARALQHREELDAIIDERVHNWAPERVALVDRIVLRLGLAELLYIPETPVKVVIDEAIELAKRFSTSESGSFVNGVLDAAARDLKARIER